VSRARIARSIRAAESTHLLSTPKIDWPDCGEYSQCKLLRDNQVSPQVIGPVISKLSPLILLMPVLLSGCGRKSLQSTTESSINCAVEIQIAVVSGLNEGDKLDDGEWQVAASCILPVHSTGGPGHVVCNTDGTVIELQWEDVQMTHAGEPPRKGPSSNSGPSS
jgi:hypothetical protein